MKQQVKHAKNLQNNAVSFSTFCYACGAFGHDIFFAALNGYMIFYITSQLFNELPKSESERYIQIITLTMFILRMVELVIDPLIGGLIDGFSFKRWGKFKPSILGGGIIGSLCLLALFSDLGGLSFSNPMAYVVCFIIIFSVFDVAYSFKDIALWGMIPALSTKTKDRETIGTWARIGSTVGGSLVPIVVVPIVLFFSRNKTNTDSLVGDKRGWFIFAIFVAIFSFLGALVLSIGTKEAVSPLRQEREKLTMKTIFTILVKNDQLLWVILVKICFAIGPALTASFNFYYFQYILGMPKSYSLLGLIGLPLGFISVAMFPLATKILKSRANVFYIGMFIMLLGIAVYLFAQKNLILVLIASNLVSFPGPIVFLALMITITDCVEYGQLKTGVRSETATLSLRPLVDKMAGAITNLVIGTAAVMAGMINDATAQTVAENPNNIIIFKIWMFGVPAVFIILGIIFYKLKVKLTEKMHSEIVGKLLQDLEQKDLKQNSLEQNDKA